MSREVFAGMAYHSSTGGQDAKKFEAFHGLLLDTPKTETEIGLAVGLTTGAVTIALNILNPFWVSREKTRTVYDYATKALGQVEFEIATDQRDPNSMHQGWLETIRSGLEIAASGTDSQIIKLTPFFNRESQADLFALNRSIWYSLTPAGLYDPYAFAAGIAINSIRAEPALLQ